MSRSFDSNKTHPVVQNTSSFKADSARAVWGKLWSRDLPPAGASPNCQTDLPAAALLLLLLPTPALTSALVCGLPSTPRITRPFQLILLVVCLFLSLCSYHAIYDAFLGRSGLLPSRSSTLRSSPETPSPPLHRPPTTRLTLSSVPVFHLLYS